MLSFHVNERIVLSDIKEHKWMKMKKQKLKSKSISKPNKNIVDQMKRLGNLKNIYEKLNSKCINQIKMTYKFIEKNQNISRKYLTYQSIDEVIFTYFPQSELKLSQKQKK